MLINIREKGTGRIGILNTDIQPFDPIRFETIDNQANQPTQPVKNSSQSGDVSLLVDKILPFLKNIIPATQNVANDVTQSIIQMSPEVQQANASVMDLQNQKLDILSQSQREKDPAKKKKLYDLAMKYRTMLPAKPVFSEDVNKSPITRGLAVGGELAPLLLSWGAKGATPASRIASMGLQGGASSGARTLLSLQDMTPEERATATGKSALYGALLAGGLQAGGEIYNKIKAPSPSTSSLTQAERDINNVKMNPKSYDPYGEMQQTQNIINERLGTGSAIDKMKKYPSVMKGIDSEIKTELADSTISPDPNTIIKDYTENFTNNSAWGAKDSRVLESLNNKIDMIKSATSKSNPADIDLALYQLKNNQNITPVLTKLEKGTQLTPPEEARYFLWQTLKPHLDTISPVISKLNSEQHLLIDAKPFLIKSAESAGPAIPIPTTMGKIPLPISRAGFQTGSSALSQVLSPTANVNRLSSLLNLGKQFTQPIAGAVKQTVPILEKFIPNIVNNMTQGNQNVPINTSLPEPLSSTLQGQNTIPQVQGAETQQTNYITGYSPEQLYSGILAAQQAGDKASASQLRQMYDDEISYQKINNPIPKVQQIAQIRAKGEAQQGLAQLQSIKKELGMIDSAGNDTGKVDLLKLKMEKLSPLTHALDVAMGSVLSHLSAARSARGASGTESSMAGIEKTFGFGLGDTEESVKAKVKDMEQLLTSILNEPAGTDSSTIQTTP